MKQETRAKREREMTKFKSAVGPETLGGGLEDDDGGLGERGLDDEE